MTRERTSASTAPATDATRARSALQNMASLEAACATAMQKEGVVGVMCVDAAGLCLYSAGTVSDASAGAVAAVVTYSKMLLGEDAVVTIDSPKGKMLLTRSEEATIALFMAA